MRKVTLDQIGQKLHQALIKRPQRQIKRESLRGINNAVFRHSVIQSAVKLLAEFEGVLMVVFISHPDVESLPLNSTASVADHNSAFPSSSDGDFRAIGEIARCCTHLECITVGQFCSARGDAVCLSAALFAAAIG
ncbi:hypothetical protein FGO68_gene5098 [Halteria grandinella]|uniref:Uncharacterized protein n=1 Tax=Halteria grandinella TaxID=5974 RepID=A0A8J8SYS5_HALGN|nr:hypothetical protein FGO68_gene5098 [Halteria grandinella]